MTVELVGEAGGLVHARMYGTGRSEFAVYRSVFDEPWGFDYEYAELPGRPRELIWIDSGMMTAHIGSRRWALTPGRALWIPAGVPSEVVPNVASTGFCLQFAAGRPQFDPAVPTLFAVSPLARELLLALGRSGLADAGAGAMVGLLLSELEVLPDAGTDLPMPTEERALAIARGLLADPADPRTLAAWAASVFGSEKTVARAFLDQCGMTFGTWRTMARLFASMPLLMTDLPVTAVAARVGYASPGSYIDAFRRHLGSTPGELRNGDRHR
ncbi:helix-turn-helix transcriptional regulator [Nakamurella alba]|uniref:helix-turn-helix transcriptional regulator n=1 Tax=Nakamurella alba TaxID=2665158 RepID=UPI0018A97620|nr:AraC family transcriptional regulator [Nakamurella alba]